MNLTRHKNRVFSSGGPQLNEEERDAMRRAGRFNAELLDVLRPHAKPGIKTIALDKLAYEYTMDHGHTPACLGYQQGRSTPPFPGSICTSVNEVVCHGIPSEYELHEGDIVNLDLTTIVDGWHGDQSETFLIGDVSEEARKVTQAAFDCMWLGIRAIKPGGKVNDIGRAIERHAYQLGLSVVQEYQGHGLGRRFHQKPDIHHFEQEGDRTRIDPGVCFTIEPMINVGVWRTRGDDPDGWTVRTADGKLTAQFEHTILMTEQGPEVLTMTQQGPKEGHKF
ncbi:MAG: type I methionyl aminopeptidase [Pirellulales bacterium]|nr:type I methionyl aminopeptidase [Pirellulales bacterium]